MAVYRTTQDILKQSWENLSDLPSTDLYPQREYCNTWQSLDYTDIRLWELIYHMPGGISVYAAWDPYTEFYIIVHDLFKKLPCGIEQFYGPTAETNVIDRLQTFNITLTKNQVWINPDYTWMYDKLSSI